MLKIRGLADVKGDHDAIKLEHSSSSSSAAATPSSSLPEIIPVAKQPKINACPDWDLNKIDFLMRNASTASPSTANNANARYQRKRNWPNGSTATLTTSTNPANANSTTNHTISLCSRNLKNNNGNSSTSNSNSSEYFNIFLVYKLVPSVIRSKIYKWIKVRVSILNPILESLSLIL